MTRKSTVEDEYPINDYEDAGVVYAREAEKVYGAPLNENVVYNDEAEELGISANDKVVIVKAEDGSVEEIYLDDGGEFMDEVEGFYM